MKGKFEKLFVAAIVIFFLMSSMMTISKVSFASKAQSIPNIQDPTPGYFDTSLYMLGDCYVKVLLLESNGTIDPETENWTSEEINKVQEEIGFALANWSSWNPDAITFYADYSIVETSYEPITRPIKDIVLAISEVLTTKGYPLPPGGLWIHQVYDYVNVLRDLHNTDWSFVVFLVDSSEDADGYFEGGGGPECSYGGPYILMTRDNGKQYIGFEGMDKVMAHESGNVFWAKDEDIDNPRYGGYLNGSTIPFSGCIMDGLLLSNWCVSNGTRNQVGWTDTDKDGIPDILDTFPSVFIDSTNTLGRKINITGSARVNPYPNLGKVGSGRNVTINKISDVQIRIDGGEWASATLTPWSFRKLIRWPDVYADKTTTAVVNFTFTSELLSPGSHFIEVRATNQWGNSGYTNQTVIVPEVTHDVALTKLEPYRNVTSNNTVTSINVTISNQGNTAEDFNLTLYYNSSILSTQTIFLNEQTSKNVTFSWNTTGLSLGNYTIRAEAPIPGDVNVADNTLTYDLIRLSIVGDVNADERVNIIDISIVAVAFGTKSGDSKWNANADLNENGTINILDIAIVAVNFGMTT